MVIFPSGVFARKLTTVRSANEEFDTKLITKKERAHTIQYFIPLRNICVIEKPFIWKLMFTTFIGDLPMLFLSRKPYW